MVRFRLLVDLELCCWCLLMGLVQLGNMVLSAFEVVVDEFGFDGILIYELQADRCGTATDGRYEVYDGIYDAGDDALLV